jgi:TetR/AcrR family transcriptional regulator, transcriptional repressor for nem operon
MEAMSEYSEKAIEILEAAELRIRRGGFDAVSYRDLATDVGIRAASVHYHFPQKALLGAAVVDRYTEKVLAAIGPIDLGKTNVAEHLRRFCGVYEAAVRDEGLICLCCVLGSESQDLPDLVVAAVRRFFTRLLEWVELVVADDLRSVEDHRPDAKILAAQTLGSLQGTMILAVTLQQPELMGQVRDRIVQSAIG